MANIILILITMSTAPSIPEPTSIPTSIPAPITPEQSYAITVTQADIDVWDWRRNFPQPIKLDNISKVMDPYNQFSILKSMEGLLDKLSKLSSYNCQAQVCREQINQVLSKFFSNANSRKDFEHVLDLCIFQKRVIDQKLF